MAAGWRQGLSIYEKALSKTTAPDKHAALHADFGVARAAYFHFKSVANQVRFTVARNQLLSGSLNRTERQAGIETIRSIVTDEIQNAERLFGLTRIDPRIGFEASNHYYYFPMDLVEKVINCQYILNVWLPRQSAK
jgi:hypothetical protein